MNKLAYESAIYAAFLDELEKLGYPVDEIMKEAISLAPVKALAGKAMGGLKSAVTPSSVKMQRALTAPAPGAVGGDVQKAMNLARQRQLNPALRASPATTKVRAVGPSMQPTPAAGGSSMIWGR